MTADTPLAPKLRFPEFRDGPTWLAPQLDDLYDFRRTNTLSRDKLNYETGTIRNIHYGDIHTKFKPLFRVGNEHVPYINPDASANGFDDDAFCEEGDIALADASEDLDDVGKAIEIVSLDGERVVAGTHTILATRRGSVPIIGFGGQLFQSAVVRAGIKKEAQGAKVYGISANRISAVPVPVPPTEAEQQKVADCLGSLDGLIAAQGRTLEALRQHKQGLMQQLFPQPGVTVPRLRFPEFHDAGEWKRDNIGSIASISKGKGVSKAEIAKNSLTPCIRYAELYTHYGEVIREVRSRTNIPPEDLVLSYAGDVIVPASGETRADIARAACVVPEGIALGSDLNILRSELNGLFFSYLLNSPLRYSIAQLAQGDTVAHLYPGQLSRVSITYPSPTEQQKIADCLGSLDGLIAAQCRKLETLRQHKQGLMQQLFPSPERITS